MFRKLSVMLACATIGVLLSGTDVESRQLTKEESALRGDGWFETCVVDNDNQPQCLCGTPPAWAPPALCFADCNGDNAGALAYICNEEKDEFCYETLFPFYCSHSDKTCGPMKFGSCPPGGGPMNVNPPAGWDAPPGPIHCGNRANCGF